ncbi:MAG: hypothetical protein ACRD4X_17315 [Candidatus Acidiferrales bacterium]
MLCCGGSRRSAREKFLLQVCNKLALVAACAAMTFVARPVFAQRGGGHAGGGHWGGAVGHSTGGGHFGGGRSSGTGRSGRSWTLSAPRGGIVVVSGAQARGGSGDARGYGRGGAESWSYAGEPSELPVGLRGFAGQEESAAPAEPRQITIGFPLTGADSLSGTKVRSQTPLKFAGQGHSIWRASPDQVTVGSARPAPPGSSPVSQLGQWRIQPERFAKNDGLGRAVFQHRFHRRFFFGPGFGFYGYGGTGLGFFSDCPNWLVPNWEWEQDYAGVCDIYSGFGDSGEAGHSSTGAYGEDGANGAPQADTQRIYGAYAYGAPAASEGKSVRDDIESESLGYRSADADALNSRGPDTLIYLADGTNYAVANYWLAGGDLHYVTSYGAEDAMPIGQIDLQRTVDANAARGVQFTLRPTPATGSGGSE